MSSDDFRAMLQGVLDDRGAKREDAEAKRQAKLDALKQKYGGWGEFPTLKPMGKDDIIAVIWQVKPGDKLAVRFKPEGVHEMIYLEGMAHHGAVEVRLQDTALLMGIRLSSSWDLDENRNWRLTAGSKWDPDWFVGRLLRAIESIAIVK